MAFVCSTTRLEISVTSRSCHGRLLCTGRIFHEHDTNCTNPERLHAPNASSSTRRGQGPMYTYIVTATDNFISEILTVVRRQTMRGAMILHLKDQKSVGSGNGSSPVVNSYASIFTC